MSTTDTTRPDVKMNFSYLDGPAVFTEEEVPKKDRLPLPRFTVSGKRFLVYQDAGEEKIGRIYVPKDVQERWRPTVGTIVSIGDGYEPEDPIFMEEGLYDWSPYQVGQRVMWSKYDDTVIKIPVEDEWWDSDEEKEREQGGVKVTVLHVKQVIGILSPEKPDLQVIE